MDEIEKDNMKILPPVKTNRVVALCLIAIIGMGGLVICSNGAYSQLNATIENQTISSCASGCNTMLSLVHTNDTNVNAAALAACWNACGGNVQQT